MTSRWRSKVLISNRNSEQKRTCRSHTVKAAITDRNANFESFRSDYPFNWGSWEFSTVLVLSRFDHDVITGIDGKEDAQARALKIKHGEKMCVNQHWKITYFCIIPVTSDCFDRINHYKKLHYVLVLLKQHCCMRNTKFSGPHDLIYKFRTDF